MTRENRPEGDSLKSRTASETSREASEDDRREFSKRADGGTAGDVPLNITGHEAEKERRNTLGSDGEPETNGHDG